MDLNFCDSYLQHHDLARFLAEPENDAGFTDFLRRYRDWEAAGANNAVSNMAFYFGGTADARRALEAGDGVAEGRVRKDAGANHCPYFLDFVNAGEASDASVQGELAARGAAVDPAALGQLTPFELSLQAFVKGAPLTEMTRGLLNGACFLHNEIRQSALTGGETASADEFYAIPGYEMMQFRRNVSEAHWGELMRRIVEATEVTKLNTINIDRAVQLRLGKKDTGENYPPTGVGSGIVIFGGE